MTKEIRDTILAVIALCERFGLEPTLDRIEGFSGLRLTQAMVDAALDPDERKVIAGIECRRYDVIARPVNTPGGQSGAAYVPEIERAVQVYHAKYGDCTFLRWDGGAAVVRIEHEWLDPDAPAGYPTMGATPAGARYWTPPQELWVAVN